MGGPDSTWWEKAKSRSAKPEPLPAAPGSEPRLTDEELDWLEAEDAGFAADGRDHEPAAEFFGAFGRLVAEVRHLRNLERRP